MVDHPPGANPPRRAFAWAASPAALPAIVLGVLALRLVYLALLSPFTLTEDEAHYWDWSRHLGWSYYSKGPGVAWMIALSTGLLGDSEWGVRAPAAVFGAIGAFAAAVLAGDVFRDRRVATLAGLAYLSMPGVQVTSMLMTIDGPFLACWALACLAAWRALAHGSGPAWLGLGLALGAGVLFKYTILLLVPGVAVFAVLRRGGLRAAGAGWIAGGAGLALAGLAPIVVWNAQHDWATVRHLLGHLGVAGGDVAVAPAGRFDYDPRWTAEFALYSLAVAGAVLPLSLQAIVNLRRARGPERREGWAPAGPAFLYCCAAPIGLFYTGVTFFTDVEANWALASFVSLTPACAWAAVDGFTRADAGVKFAWNACVLALVVVTGGTALVGAAAGTGGPVLGAAVQRVTAGRALAAEAAGVAEDLRARTGKEPFYAAVHYGRASLLAFYLPGHPRVYAASAHMGGRRTQFDAWAFTDLSRKDVNDALRGRPGVVFGGTGARWPELFEEVTEIGALPSEPKRNRWVWAGRGFLGFDAVPRRVVEGRVP